MPIVRKAGRRQPRQVEQSIREEILNGPSRFRGLGKSEARYVIALVNP